MKNLRRRPSPSRAMHRRPPRRARRARKNRHVRRPNRRAPPSSWMPTAIRSPMLPTPPPPPPHLVHRRARCTLRAHLDRHAPPSTVKTIPLPPTATRRNRRRRSVRTVRATRRRRHRRARGPTNRRQTLQCRVRAPPTRSTRLERPISSSQFRRRPPTARAPLYRAFLPSQSARHAPTRRNAPHPPSMQRR